MERYQPFDQPYPLTSGWGERWGVLRNMSPGTTVSDRPNCGVRDSVVTPNRSCPSRVVSDSAHVAFGKFRSGVGFATPSPFRCGVRHVCSMISEKQVVGSDAPGVVAGMADQHVGVRQFAVEIGDGVTDSMGFAGDAVAEPETSVAVFIQAIRPLPTSVALGNFGPEPFFDGGDVPLGDQDTKVVATPSRLPSPIVDYTQSPPKPTVGSAVGVSDSAGNIVHCQFQSVVGSGRRRPVAAGRRHYSTGGPS